MVPAEFPEKRGVFGEKHRAGFLRAFHPNEEAIFLDVHFRRMRFTAAGAERPQLPICFGDL
jgi:hypothetical protein